MPMPDAAAPVVSVLMGVYYRKADTVLLERSVRSILEQTFRDFEFLICDDGSTAEAASLLENLAAEDSRIRLVRVGTLFTLPQKLNACLEAAHGRLLARMDDDDWSEPQRFEKQLRALEENPGAAFVGSNVLLWQNGTCVGSRELPSRPTVQDFLFVQPFIHPTLIFRTEALRAVGGYSEDPHCILCEDYDLLLRMYARGYWGINLTDELLCYTVPAPGEHRRKMKHRFNESVTRYHRFRELKLLPKALPYVLKPVAVGLLPGQLVQWLRKQIY